MNAMFTEKQKQLIADLAIDLAPEMAQIEAKPETTQHHYADYGALLSRLAKGNRTVAMVLAHAFIKAGAHPVGVANGLKIFV